MSLSVCVSVCLSVSRSGAGWRSTAGLSLCLCLSVWEQERRGVALNSRAAALMGMHRDEALARFAYHEALTHTHARARTHARTHTTHTHTHHGRLYRRTHARTHARKHARTHARAAIHREGMYSAPEKGNLPSVCVCVCARACLVVCEGGSRESLKDTRGVFEIPRKCCIISCIFIASIETQAFPGGSRESLKDTHSTVKESGGGGLEGEGG